MHSTCINKVSPDVYIHIYMTNRLRSPTICCRQAGDSGNLPGDVIQCKSKGLRTRVQGPEKRRCPNSSRQKAKGMNSFFFHLLFYSGPQGIWWGLLTLGKAIYLTGNFFLGCTFKFPLQFILTWNIIKLYLMADNASDLYRYDSVVGCFYLWDLFSCVVRALK